MTIFEELIRSKSMNNLSYIAILTSDPVKAIDVYVKKTGYEPTVLLCRPDFSISNHPLIAESRNAAWGVFLVSHLVNPDEVENSSVQAIYQERDEPSGKQSARKLDLSFPKSKVGRPERPKACCPHCHSLIANFEDLGYWYGWALGITPPYWDELREYVFKRDNYTCQKCDKKFPIALLQAHHKVHKEDGGEDSTRNLETLCVDCHQDTKPIFEDEQ